jgi:hypothetical protein
VSGVSIISVWFVVVPWLVFVAGVIGVVFWLRKSPRSPRRRRRGSRGMPHQRRQGGEKEADLGRYKATSS